MFREERYIQIKMELLLRQSCYIKTFGGTKVSLEMEYSISWFGPLLFERSGRMGKVLIWFVIIISTVVLYCLMIMKDKAESDELYEELMRKLILKGGDLQVLWFNTEDMKKVEKMAKKYGILYGQMMRVIRSTQCRRKILKFLNRRQTPKEVPCA